jgi:hypothetical protein
MNFPDTPNRFSQSRTMGACCYCSAGAITLLSAALWIVAALEKVKLTARGNDMQTIALVNPSRRRKSRRSTSHLKKWQFKANPSKRRRRRSRGSRKSGGVGFVKSFSPSVRNIQPMLIGAAQGAAGALAVNAIVRYAPLPAMLITGRMAFLTRAALALGVGYVASNVLPNRVAARMAEGALTVVAVDALRDLILTTTGVSLAGVSYYSPAQLVRGRRPAPSSVQGVGKQLTSVSGTGKYLGANASRIAVNSGYGMPNYGQR